MLTQRGRDEMYSDDEAARRATAPLRRALTTPYAPAT